MFRKFAVKTAIIIVLLFLVVLSLSQIGIRVEPIGRWVDTWMLKLEQTQRFVAARSWVREHVPKWNDKNLPHERLKRLFSAKKKDAKAKDEEANTLSELNESKVAPNPNVLGWDPPKTRKKPPQENIDAKERRQLEELLPEK